MCANIFTYRLENETPDTKLSELEMELEDVENEERRLLDELKALDEEERATLEAIKEQEAEAKRLAKEESKLWKQYAKHRIDYLSTDDEYRR